MRLTGPTSSPTAKPAEGRTADATPAVPVSPEGPSAPADVQVAAGVPGGDDGFDPIGPLPKPLPSTPLETLYTDPFHHDTVGDRFAELVDQTTSTIDGAFFEIADPRITGALSRAAERGVTVRLVTDDNYFRNEEDLPTLQARVPVLDAANLWFRALRRVKPTDADLDAKVDALLAELPSIEAGLANAPGEPMGRDFESSRLYLEALKARDPEADRSEPDKLWRSLSNQVGEERVRLAFRPSYDLMLEAGVQIRDDDDSDLSHNKYMVLDGETTWVGSYNLQGLKSDSGDTQGLYSAADNVVVLPSTQLAAQFLEDFRQMFEDGNFHDDKAPQKPIEVQVNGVPVTPFFSPRDPILSNMTADLGSLLIRMRDAKERGEPFEPPVIRLAGFTMSYGGTQAMVDTLALLHEEGADVLVISDLLSSSTSASSIRVLREKGVPVQVAEHGLLMHHKFLSIEEQGRPVVWTGSANFTQPAYYENDESVVRIESQEMVTAYQAIFDSLSDNIRPESAVDALLADPLFEGEADEAWLAIDPSSIRTLQDAMRYANLRWR